MVEVNQFFREDVDVDKSTKEAIIRDRKEMPNKSVEEIKELLENYHSLDNPKNPLISFLSVETLDTITVKELASGLRVVSKDEGTISTINRSEYQELVEYWEEGNPKTLDELEELAF